MTTFLKKKPQALEAEALPTMRAAFERALETWEHHPDRVAAAGTLADLRQQLAEVESQINDATARRGAQVRASEALTMRAEALLRGEPVPEPDPELDLRRLGALYDRRFVVREAIELQTARLRAIDDRVSAEIATTLLAPYRPLVAEMGQALVLFGAAQDAVMEVFERLDGAGLRVLSHLRPMLFTMPGSGPKEFSLREEFSVINLWRRDAREHGLH